MGAVAEFDPDSGNAQRAEQRVVRIATTRAYSLRCAAQRAFQSVGQCGVPRILGVTGCRVSGILGRSETIDLRTPGCGISAVDMETQENGLWHLTGGIDPLLVGYKEVAVAGENNTKAGFFQAGAELLRNEKSDLFLGGTFKRGAGVASAVAGINDDGRNGFPMLDVGRTKNGVQPHDPIQAGDQEGTAWVAGEGVREGERYAAEPHGERSRTELKADIGVAQGEGSFLRGTHPAVQFVKITQLVDGLIRDTLHDRGRGPGVGLLSRLRGSRLNRTAGDEKERAQSQQKGNRASEKTSAGSGAWRSWTRGSHYGAEREG